MAFNPVFPYQNQFQNNMGINAMNMGINAMNTMNPVNNMMPFNNMGLNSMTPMNLMPAINNQQLPTFVPVLPLSRRKFYYDDGDEEYIIPTPKPVYKLRCPTPALPVRQIVEPVPVPVTPYSYSRYAYPSPAAYTYPYYDYY
jgi:hypothetical protein